MSSARFASLNEDELKAITNAKDSLNTKNATKYSVNTFRNYLKEKKLQENFENFTKSELDIILRNFYAEIRNGKGELYKRTSLLSIRSGICRHIAAVNSYDIINDVEFKSSNEMFKSMCKLTTREGKGVVDHKDGIISQDIEKLYVSHVFNIDSPTGLLSKVWFELCLYFIVVVEGKTSVN